MCILSLFGRIPTVFLSKTQKCEPGEFLSLVKINACFYI